MNKETVAEEFKAALAKGDDFTVVQFGDYGWELQSAHCILEFSFDRYYPDGYLLMVREPTAPRSKRMNIVLLQHIRGAYDPSCTPGIPRDDARVFERFFPDLLAGDFSIRAENDRLEMEFFGNKMSAVLALPKEHPTRRKFDRYDISWMKKV